MHLISKYIFSFFPPTGKLVVMSPEVFVRNFRLFELSTLLCDHSKIILKKFDFVFRNLNPQNKIFFPRHFFEDA